MWKHSMGHFLSWTYYFIFVGSRTSIQSSRKISERRNVLLGVTPSRPSHIPTPTPFGMARNSFSRCLDIHVLMGCLLFLVSTHHYLYSLIYTVVHVMMLYDLSNGPCWKRRRSSCYHARHSSIFTIRLVIGLGGHMM